jgi:hypothetical protein
VVPETVGVIQVTSAVAADNVQPELAVTVNDPLPPPATAEAELDDSEYEHVTPACVTVNVCPPTVTVPVRELVLVLACTV